MKKPTRFDYFTLFAAVFLAVTAKADTWGDFKKATNSVVKQIRNASGPFLGQFEFDEKSEKGRMVHTATQLAYNTLTRAADNLSKTLTENPQAEFANSELLKTIVDTRTKMSQKYINHKIFYAINDQDEDKRVCSKSGVVAFEHNATTTIPLPITDEVQLATAYIYLCNSFFDSSERDDNTRGYAMVHESLHVNGFKDECGLTKTHMLIQYWVGEMPDSAFPYLEQCGLREYKNSIESKLKH